MVPELKDFVPHLAYPSSIDLAAEDSVGGRGLQGILGLDVLAPGPHHFPVRNYAMPRSVRHAGRHVSHIGTHNKRAISATCPIAVTIRLPWNIYGISGGFFACIAAEYSLVFGGFVATSVIALRGFSAKASDTISTSGGLATTLNGQTAVILMFSAAIALVLSLFYIFLVRTFTKIILEVSLALSVITSVAYCVYLWVKGVSAVPETSQTVCMAHITYSKRREPLS